MNKSHCHRLTIAAGVVCLLTSIIGCGKPDPKDRFVRPENITDFHKLFKTNCSGCHGEQATLGIAPPLNDELFQTIVSDQTLTDLVSKGRTGTHMPAFAIDNGGTLTSKQVKIVVDGIRMTWGGKRLEQNDLPAYAISQDDPAGLNSPDADADAGAAVFKAACASCHGDDGMGGKDGGPIAVAALSHLMSDQLLRRTIIVGRTDLGMPNYIESGKQSSLGRALTADEIVNLSAYVRKLQRRSSPREQTNDKSSKADPTSGGSENQNDE